MGELINLKEYKDRKEKAERQEIEDDIKRLRVELREMIGDMEEFGTAMWDTSWVDQLPALLRIDKALDGYAQASHDLDSILDTD